MATKKNMNNEFVVIYSNGSRKRMTLRPETLDIVKSVAAPILSVLASCAGTRAMIEDIPNVVAISRADHDILHWCGRERHAAAFRLGQMDMQQAAADMLVDLAGSTNGISRSTLLDAAQMIRSLSVCEEAKEAADDDA